MNTPTDLLPSQRRIIRGVALFDLVATASFAAPFTAPVFVAVLYWFEYFLVGNSVPPPFESVQWLLMTIAGSLGVLWAIVRIRQPLASLAHADAIARCWIAALILYYVLDGNAPKMLLVFVATEIGGAVLQWRVLADRTNTHLYEVARPKKEGG